MTKAELLKQLRAMKGDSYDPETTHVEADKLLLEYIGSPAVNEAFAAIYKWYA